MKSEEVSGRLPRNRRREGENGRMDPDVQLGKVALGYRVPDPDEVFASRMEDRLNERREKMYNAVKDRQAYWKSQPT